MKAIVTQGYGGNKRIVGSSNAHLVTTKGLTLSMHIDDSSLRNWDRQIYGMIEAAGTTGHKLVDTAVHTILNNSYMYVPRDTNTLAGSGYARTESVIARKLGVDLVTRETVFTGVVGYGEDTGEINPKTGLKPSQYAWEVHEDLSVKHPNGGEAKFLERAYREYIAEQWPSEMVNAERTIYEGKSNSYKPMFSYSNNAKIFRGRGRAKRKERRADTKSNYERLNEIYAAVKR